MKPTVPHRHPSTPRRTPGLRPLAVLLGLGGPSREQWNVLGESLVVGDAAMDELVEWMYREGLAETRVLFDRALREGIAAVPEAPEPLRDFFTEVEKPPSWLDYGGTLPRGAGYRATIQVRLIHALVRRHVAAMPDWRAEEWGLPINQTDMATSLVGALIAPFVGAMSMGVVVSRRELAAAAHLTRYVGWLIGVDEPLLPKDFRDAVRILYHSLPAITNPDETSQQLALPMADDPLTWHYSVLRGLRGRIARAQHLSIAGTFLGPAAMVRLGLPPQWRPWYPMLRVPVNLVRSAITWTVPGGRERSARRGRRVQAAFLQTLLGDHPVVIGASAQHIDRAA